MYGVMLQGDDLRKRMMEIHNLRRAGQSIVHYSYFVEGMLIMDARRNNVEWAALENELDLDRYVPHPYLLTYILMAIR